MNGGSGSVITQIARNRSRARWTTGRHDRRVVRRPYRERPSASPPLVGASLLWRSRPGSTARSHQPRSRHGVSTGVVGNRRSILDQSRAAFRRRRRRRTGSSGPCCGRHSGSHLHADLHYRDGFLAAHRRHTLPCAVERGLQARPEVGRAGEGCQATIRGGVQPAGEERRSPDMVGEGNLGGGLGLLWRGLQPAVAVGLAVASLSPRTPRNGGRRRRCGRLQQRRGRISSSS